MSIEVPDEQVYYYECSAGSFRLVCFIPFAELQSLAAAERIKEEALRDFPDGLDLDCTEPDFAEFEKSYGYRHPHEAEELRRAFLALFSSTKGWQKFQGSGFLAATVLEATLDPVETAVRETAEVSERATRALAAEPDRREVTRQRAAQRSVLREALVELEVEGVDPSKSLREQSFREIKMSKGEPAPQFYARLQRHRS